MISDVESAQINNYKKQESFEFEIKFKNGKTSWKIKAPTEVRN